MIRVAVSLIGNGLSPEAVFVELRGKHDQTITDAEIRGVIEWALGKNPQPSGYQKHYHNSPIPRPVQHVTEESAASAVERFLRGFRCDEADLWHASPWRPLEDWRMDSIMVFSALFFGHEYINIVTSHGAEGKPVGIGHTNLRDDWIRKFRGHGTPHSKAGAWFRFNPTTEKGSGQSGGHSDKDVTAFRFMLIESDKLPITLQLSFYGKLSLPVSAIYLSGGKSVHCLIRMDCTYADEYGRQVGHILATLAPFGFDGANKNASRLSRLPGASRKIGAEGAGEQRLLYLNPEPTRGERIFP